MPCAPAPSSGPHFQHVGRPGLAGWTATGHGRHSSVLHAGTSYTAGRRLHSGPELFTAPGLGWLVTQQTQPVTLQKPRVTEGREITGDQITVKPKPRPSQKPAGSIPGRAPADVSRAPSCRPGMASHRQTGRLHWEWGLRWFPLADAEANYYPTTQRTGELLTCQWASFEDR